MKNYKNKKIKVGLVGCGRISKNHFLSFEEHKNDILLKSICDIDQKIVDQHTKKYNVSGYNNLDDMLKNEELDLVSICTPSGLHADQAKLISSFGVNVLTEKPMATRWSDGLDMVEACKRDRTRLFVVKQNRENKTLKLLKRAIDENRFGRLHMVHVNVFWTRPQSYYDQAEWRGTWRHDGGALMNQASHYVDLLDWLVGPVDKVQSMVSTHRNIEVEDTGVLNIKWKNGSLGSMSVTMLTYPDNLEGSITLIGEKGTVKVGGMAVNRIETWKFEDKRDYDADIFNANYVVNSVYGHGHVLYYKNVIQSMKENTPPEVDGEEGLKSLELIIAAYQSAREGVSVSLPLKL